MTLLEGKVLESQRSGFKLGLVSDSEPHIFTCKWEELFVIGRAVVRSESIRVLATGNSNILGLSFELL